MLRIYRVAISPVLAAISGPLGLGCRFHPTCSQYAMQAVERHGVIRGATLSLRRLCRCHPWGGCGEDPVPPLSGRDAEKRRHREMESRFRFPWVSRPVTTPRLVVPLSSSSTPPHGS